MSKITLSFLEHQIPFLLVLPLCNTSLSKHDSMLITMDANAHQFVVD
jgi:hypothetical protein